MPFMILLFYEQLGDPILYQQSRGRACTGFYTPARQANIRKNHSSAWLNR